MNILIVGATGATGRLLVEQLLERGHFVKAVVRSPDKLSEKIRNHDQLFVIHASILDLSDAQMAEHVKGCDAVASCLGHNITFKGIFGHPRRLVTDATRRLCEAIEVNKPETPVKFVLMNTTGYVNPDLSERISFAETCIISLLRVLIPPHVDNEQAANFLRTEIGMNNKAIEWSAVRPDDLINEKTVTDYEVYPSPIRSAIFNAGKTSRINVGHFMAELITNSDTWSKWRWQTPVIYNKSSL